MAGRTLLSLALFLIARVALAAGPACGSSTPLTLIGVDTASGAMLLSSPAAGPGDPWIVELSGDGSRARLHPDRAKGRFGGSVGPGPVIAASPCGKTCLQPVRWSAGEWEPIGDPLHVPTATNMTPTYDRTGAAWVLIHSPTPESGKVRVQAFRLENREWRSRGELTVTAVGQPPALPAPQRKDGVLVGTGLFSASSRPELWVSGVPNLPTARRGQLIALTGTAAAYLSGDGVVYLSDDSGKRWRRSTWTPWGSGGTGGGGGDGTVGMWRQGSDYWVDLPYGDHDGALRLAWFDRRVPSEEKILLTRLTQGGDWLRLAETRSDVRTRNESLGLTQILVPKGDSWVLLTGCVATKGTSSLVLRVFDGKNLSEPKLVPLKQ
ncbi:MAG TPA: hypothetical protein VN493_19930 [Thermoanaerobaculia bacterium]|nr:hypothetical protein [Thermoanaerobaculia bacterium]